MTGGVFLLDKAAGVTSRKAAGSVARALGFRKYGHCGTLDPDATGLLVVLLGRATRLAPYLSGGTKDYCFTAVFGISTDTLDTSGQVTGTCDCSRLTVKMVDEALEGLTGTFQQRTPLFSAVRVGGRRGYNLARNGETPDMPFRTVTVTNWKRGDLDEGRMELSATVSPGTYVRALVRDLGEALGSCAAAEGIRRTASGPFSLNDAARGPEGPGGILSMAEAAGRVMGSLELSLEEARSVAHGGDIYRDFTGTAALLGPSGDLIAIGKGSEGSVHPSTVLSLPEEIA